MRRSQDDEYLQFHVRARARPDRAGVEAGGRNNNDLLISIQNASGIASNVFGLESLCKGPIV